MGGDGGVMGWWWWGDGGHASEADGAFTSYLQRYHFDDFGTALLSIFVVLSGENWNEIMFDSHRAT